MACFFLAERLTLVARDVEQPYVELDVLPGQHGCLDPARGACMVGAGNFKLRPEGPVRPGKTVLMFQDALGWEFLDLLFWEEGL